MFKNWLKKRALKKIIKEQQSSVDELLDEQIKEALKSVNETKRTADKLIKLKLIKKETREVFDQLQELDEDYEDDEDEEPDFEKNIKNILLQKVMGNFTPKPTEPNIKDDKTPPMTIQEMAQFMTPSQKKKCKDLGYL